MPWVLPAITAVTSIVGAFTSAAKQSQDEKAQQQLQGAQEGVYGTQQGLAQQLADSNAYQPLIDAERSGASTLRANMGGYANPGAVIEDVLGNNVTQALDASVAGRRANLEGAASILNPVAAGYGGLATGAGNAAAAIGNPWQNALGTVGGNIGKIFSPGTGGGGGGGGLGSAILATGGGTSDTGADDPLVPADLSLDGLSARPPTATTSSTGTATGFGGGKGPRQ